MQTIQAIIGRILDTFYRKIIFFIFILPQKKHPRKCLTREDTVLIWS